MQLKLTQKERMLLEDQKKHEQICIEKYTNYANQAQCPQLKQLFNNHAQLERTHLDTINQLLSGNIPQMNQQQNQGTTQNTGNQNTGNTQQFTGTTKDTDMCTDMLMTEKYVSGAYNTAIFEFKDPNIRQILNHIQKEEQEHGEQIFNYMYQHGMYNPQ